MLWKASQWGKHGTNKKTWLRKIAGSSRPHLGIACRKGMIYDDMAIDFPI
jgi:hypothetical protein